MQLKSYSFFAKQETLVQMKLRLDDAHGQCYDGASTMSGVATQIIAINGKCLYTHCYGHALKLAIKDACNGIPV